VQALNLREICGVSASMVYLDSPATTSSTTYKVHTLVIQLVLVQLYKRMLEL
jgi:hypothetical protein